MHTYIIIYNFNILVNANNHNKNIFLGIDEVLT